MTTPPKPDNSNLDKDLDYQDLGVLAEDAVPHPDKEEPSSSEEDE